MTSVNSNATNIVVTEEVPARVKVTNYEPSTAGVALAEVLDDDGSNMSTAIDKTQTEPVVVPSDVVDFLSHHKRSPKEDILRLAYGGTKAAQAEKLGMIFDDFEGLLKIAQKAIGGDGAGWTDNIVEKHTDLHTKLQAARKAQTDDGSECPEWSTNTNNDIQRYILLQAKIVDLLQYDLTELFVNGAEQNLLETDPSNASDPRNVFAKKYGLSNNAYFMFVMALAFAQLRYGYSVAGEVRCGDAVRDTSCKHRRCSQKPDVPLPTRIGILGVLPKITENTTLMSLFASVLNTRRDGRRAESDDAKLAKQAITQLDCVIPQMELVKRKLAKETDKNASETRIQILIHIQDELRVWKPANDVVTAVDPNTVDADTVDADSAYNDGPDGATLTGNDEFNRNINSTDENKDRQRLIHMISRAGLKNLLNVDDNTISRVVQTFPALPPHSDPINKIRGTRNLDLVEGYVLNKSSMQHGSTPYYYAGEVAVCKRQLPLVCLSRECPSWGMDNNNVVPFIEKHCGEVPDVPDVPCVCKCIPRTRIEDTLANIRAEGPVFDISTMLFGIDMRWIYDQLVASVSKDELTKAFEKVVGNNYRKAFEKNSQVFVPGVAGAFYTNLMKHDDEDVPIEFSKRNAATAAREISEMVVAEMQPITLPIRSKMTLQQDIFDSCPNYMIPQLSKGNHMLPVVLKALKEKIDQTAYDYNCNDGSNPATNIVDATISRMFELSATPRAGSGLPKTTHYHKTLVEGASAAVELVETIRVTLPLTHSLNDAAKDLDDAKALALAKTMPSNPGQKPKVGNTHLCHGCQDHA